LRWSCALIALSHFSITETGDYPNEVSMSQTETHEIPWSAVELQLAQIVAKEAMVDVSAVTPDTKLEALGIQSADFVMILMEIEEKFDIYVSVDDELSSLETVGQFMRMIIRRIEEKSVKAAS
jgi:acyl carrier protein